MVGKESLDQIESSFWEPLDRDMIDWLDVRPPCQVLDAGCGRGDHVALFAQALHPNGSVTALDIDPEALQKTRARMSGRTEAKCVRYQEGDLRKLPFPPGHFGLVWARHMFLAPSIREQMVAVAGECQRVLKPGGRIAVCEDCYRGRLLPLDIGIGRPGIEYRLRAAFIEARVKPGCYPFGWTQLLTDAGFSRVSAHSFLFELSPPFSESQRAYLRHYLREYLGEDISPEDHQTLTQITDPNHPHDVLRRSDLYFVSVATVYTGLA
jgi:SAM-dependent methyltransferase